MASSDLDALQLAMVTLAKSHEEHELRLQSLEQRMEAIAERRRVVAP